MANYKPNTEKELAEQTPKKRGGARPGSGRKLGSGNGLVDKIQVCVTPQQKARFDKLGAAKWLRAYLNEETIASQLENKHVVHNGAVAEENVGAPEIKRVDQDKVLSVDRMQADGNASGQIDLSDYLIGQTRAPVVIEAGSDDMRMAGITQGDMLLVDRNATPVDGDLVVIYRKETFVARRFHFVKSRRIELHTERVKGKD
ncbi:MAG: S24 family peptidase, partial [Sutterellaceae bacterium]|nr:S24 family peptidase [Sutterellaceae bacterium]